MKSPGGARPSGVVWNSNYEPVPGPPVNRLWDEQDVAAFVGFRSIDELVARHPSFPATVPLAMQGRRWRPGDVVAWIDRLCADIEEPAQSTERVVTRTPEFDVSAIADLLREDRRG